MAHLGPTLGASQLPRVPPPRTNEYAPLRVVAVAAPWRRCGESAETVTWPRTLRQTTPLGSSGRPSRVRRRLPAERHPRRAHRRLPPNGATGRYPARRLPGNTNAASRYTATTTTDTSPRAHCSAIPPQRHFARPVDKCDRSTRPIDSPAPATVRLSHPPLPAATLRQAAPHATAMPAATAVAPRTLHDESGRPSTPSRASTPSARCWTRSGRAVRADTSARAPLTAQQRHPQAVHVAVDVTRGPFRGASKYPYRTASRRDAGLRPVRGVTPRAGPLCGPICASPGHSLSGQVQLGAISLDAHLRPLATAPAKKSRMLADPAISAEVLDTSRAQGEAPRSRVTLPTSGDTATRLRGAEASKRRSGAEGMLDESLHHVGCAA